MDSAQDHSCRRPSSPSQSTQSRTQLPVDTSRRESLTSCIIGYNQTMFRVIRMVTAALLAVALAVLPTVLDRCMATCEAHHDAVASTPSCHHTTSTATRIGQVPLPCGHDHHLAAVTSARSAAPTGRSLNSMAAIVPVTLPVLPDATERRRSPHSPRGSSLSLDRRSLPLRI